MRKSIVTCFAALAASVAFAAPAAAEDLATATVVVPYGDLDRAAPADAAKLDQRIEAAVEEVCTKPDIRNLKSMLAWEECKAGARAGALEQLSVLEPFASIELASAF